MVIYCKEISSIITCKITKVNKELHTFDAIEI